MKFLYVLAISFALTSGVTAKLGQLNAASIARRRLQALDDTECVGSELEPAVWEEGVSIEECTAHCETQTHDVRDCTAFVWRDADGGKCKYYAGIVTQSAKEGRTCVLMKTDHGDDSGDDGTAHGDDSGHPTNPYTTNWWVTTTTETTPYNHGDDHHDDGCNEDKCANEHGCWASDHEDAQCYEGNPSHTGDNHYDEDRHVTYHHFRCCGGDDHHDNGGDDHHDDGCNEDKCANEKGCWASDHEDSQCYEGYPSHTGVTNYDEDRHVTYHHFRCCGGQPQPQPLTEADKSIIMVVLQALLQYLLYFIKLLTGQH